MASPGIQTADGPPIGQRSRNKVFQDVEDPETQVRVVEDRTAPRRDCHPTAVMLE